MNLDTSIYSKQNVSNVLPEAVDNAQKLFEFQQVNPVKLQQSQANVQSTLNSNEQQRLANEQSARDLDFRKWADKNPPVFDQLGQVDKRQTLSNMIQAGHGSYALPVIADMLKVDAAQSQNQSELRDKVAAYAKQVSQAYQGRPAAELKDVQSKIDAYTKQQFGVSASEILGPDWMTAAKQAGISPIELESNYRSNIAAANTPEAKDVKSDLNVKFRSFVEQQAPQYANPTLTLSQAAQIPGLQDAIRSFSITGEARMGLVKESVAAGVDITRLSNIRDDLTNYWSKLWRPGEKIAVVLRRLTGSPDQARLKQLVDELKANDINIDELDNPAGAIDALSRKIKQQESKQSASQQIAGAASLQNVTPQPAVTPFQQTKPVQKPATTVQGKVQKWQLPDGRVVNVPADKAKDINVLKQLQAAKARQVN